MKRWLFVGTTSNGLLIGLLGYLFASGCSGDETVASADDAREAGVADAGAEDASEVNDAAPPPATRLPDAATAPDQQPDAEAATDDGSPAAMRQDAGCLPTSCEVLGVQCGIANDGCGGVLSCGVCTEPDAGNVAQDACAPRDCQAQGAECGSVDDGCGRTLQCGSCDNGDECGGASPNRCGCAGGQLQDSTPKTARRARSTGYSGTTDDYYALYDVPCTEASECVQPCLDKGGEEVMCGASECSGFEGETECLPPTVWQNLESIIYESDDPVDGIEYTAVFGEYKDTLITDDFQLELPEDARIKGITVEVRRATDSSIADYSVKLVKAGVVVGGERAKTEPWSTGMDWITYGGEDDLWNTTWTPADLETEDFGLAFSVLYTEQAGNARAYVDQVRVVVRYELGCE